MERAATTSSASGHMDEPLTPLLADWTSEVYFLFLETWGGWADDPPLWAIKAAAFLISSCLLLVAYLFFANSISENNEWVRLPKFKLKQSKHDEKKKKNKDNKILTNSWEVV